MANSMRDFITPKERLTFICPLLSIFESVECAGCGRTGREVANDANCELNALDEYSFSTNSGLWYCHTDCYRDSK